MQRKYAAVMAALVVACSIEAGYIAGTWKSTPQAVAAPPVEPAAKADSGSVKPDIVPPGPISKAVHDHPEKFGFKPAP